MKTTHALLPLVLCLSLSVPLGFAQNDPVTLRLAVADQQGRPSEPYVLEFIERVRTLSNGTITIDPIWDAGSDTEADFESGVIEHVTAGNFELGLAGSRAWNGAGVTSLDALQAPFLIDNDALADAVATSDLATRMLEGIASAGMVGLTLWPEDLRHPFAIPPQAPLRSPRNFAGLNIRTTPSSISYALIEALGGTPMFEGPYEGAESGLLQGASLAGRPIATGNIVFFTKFQVLFANGGAFERLSDEQQTVLRDAALATQQQAIAERPSEVDAATAWCADGGTIVMASEEQVATFKEAARPVFEQIERDPMSAEFIAVIRDLKANTSASRGATACSSRRSDPTYRGTLPPNGVYRMDIPNAEELRALGAGRGFANNNVGSTTWAFEDGTLTMRWESGNQSGDCTWTYDSTGAVLRLAVPVSECSDGPVVLEFLWREHTDGALEFLVVSTSDPNVQDLVDTRALFERIWQRVE
jgi:TRAP-type C4-dicarboxylate transport system substrate-binding protein